MKMDYVQKFIDFIENYTDEKGNKKYIERLKQLINERKEKLVVEMPDIYRYEPLLAIKLMNDLYINDKSLLNTISEMLYKLLVMLYGRIDIERIEIEFPAYDYTLMGVFPGEENKQQEEEFEGYVVFVGLIERKIVPQQKIVVAELPENVKGDKITMRLMVLEGNLVRKVKPGDKVRVRVTWEKGEDNEIQYLKVKDLVVEQHNELSDVNEVPISGLMSDYADKAPVYFIHKIIDFLEYFRDEKGRFKYREIADNIITKGYREIPLDINDLKEFDADLYTLALLFTDVFNSAFNEAFNHYIGIRSTIKEGRLPGIKLIEENGKEYVIITSEHIKFLNSLTKLNLGLEEYAKIFGGHVEEKIINNVKRKVIVVEFTRFVKTWIYDKEAKKAS